MPDVAAPTTSAVGAQVSVSWSAVTIGGAKVDYLVGRFDASSGAEAAIGSGCSGTIAATGCTESNVPPGVVALRRHADP